MQIDGLQFRAVRGELDADALHAVRAGCVARDKVDLLSTVEGVPKRDELATALADAIAAEQQSRWLIAQVKDQVVGYSRIEEWFEQDGRWVYLILGWVLPEWRGQGIGTLLLHWGEQTARHLAATQHPGEPFEFAANSNTTQPESTALLLNEGYYVGYTVLDLQLDNAARQPPQPLPSGIEIRPALPEHYRLIADSIGESYRNEYPNNRFREAWDAAESAARIGAPRHDPTLWQIAWDGDRVVGDVIPLVENGRCEIYDVSVRPDYRRHRLARSLLTRALHQVHERGVDVIRLHTVAEFPTRACELYASVGFRVMKEFPRYRKNPAQRRDLDGAERLFPESPG